MIYDPANSMIGIAVFIMVLAMAYVIFLIGITIKNNLNIDKYYSLYEYELLKKNASKNNVDLEKAEQEAIKKEKTNSLYRKMFNGTLREAIKDKMKAEMLESMEKKK